MTFDLCYGQLETKAEITFLNTGSQNEQIKYTVGLIYKTIIIYLFLW